MPCPIAHVPGGASSEMSVRVSGAKAGNGSGTTTGGDKTVAIPALERGDEVGSMAKTLEVFKASLIEGDRLRVEQEAQKLRAEEERKLALRKMADASEG